MRKIIPYLILVGELILSAWIGSFGSEAISFANKFICFAFLIIILRFQKDQLEAYKIDRGTLLVFIIFGSILHINFGIPGDGFLRIFLLVSSAIILHFLIKNYRSIPSTNYRWLITGMIITLPYELFVSFLLSLDKLPPESITPPSLWIEMIGRLLYNLSYVTPYEEFFYRGLLTTYLVYSGWSEKKALWGQGIVFWIEHSDRLDAPLIFFIALPLFTFIVSYLAYKSRQLFPGIVAHTIINVVIQ